MLAAGFTFKGDLKALKKELIEVIEYYRKHEEDI